MSRSAGMVDSAKVDTVACFINAKRIEGCSEKTLSYYRQTIVSMLAGIEKEPQEIVTEDLRKYLTVYQMSRKSSKVTIDNIRRILSSYFSWLEDEDYIVTVSYTHLLLFFIFPVIELMAGVLHVVNVFTAHFSINRDVQRGIPVSYTHLWRARCWKTF